MKANFHWVVNPTSEGNQRPIMLVSYFKKFKSRRFVYSTGEYASLGEWNIKGHLKQSSIQAHSRLTKYAEAFKKSIERNIFDKDVLRAELDKIKSPPEEINKVDLKSLVAFAEYSIDHEPVYYSESAKAMKKMTKGTLRSKKQAIERLKDFETKYKYRITFENCDQHFWKKFFEFLTDRNLSPGTRGRIVKDIRSFLNSANRKGFEVCQDYLIKGVAPTEKSEKKLIYLNENEICKIAELDLKDRPGLINSRDWLLLACGTGLRHSDLIRLDESNIIENEFGKSIRIRTQKTGSLVEIPIIFDWLEEMFIRRNWTFPEKITGQKLNLNIKELGRLAELNRLVTARIKEEDSNFTTLKDIPICEALSSHTGRRSFVSILVRKKLPLTLLSKLTGHSKLETLRLYEQLNESETAEAVYHMIKGETQMKISR